MQGTACNLSSCYFPSCHSKPRTDINTSEKAFINYYFKDDTFSVCMYVCICICINACVYQVPAEAEQGIRSLGPGVTDSLKSCGKTQVLWKKEQQVLLTTEPTLQPHGDTLVSKKVTATTTKPIRTMCTEHTILRCWVKDQNTCLQKNK